MNNTYKTKDNLKSFEKNKRVKTIAIFSVIIVLLVCIVSFAGTLAYRKQITEINSDHIKELSEHDIQLISNSINSRLDILDTISSDITKKIAKGEENIPDLLHSACEMINEADKLALLSKDGSMLTNSYLREIRQDIANLCIEKEDRFVCRFDNIKDILPDQRREYILYCVKIKTINFEDHTYDYLCCFIKPGILDGELKKDSYQGKGFSSVIDYDGNYILNINSNHSFLERDNVFDELKSVDDYSSINEFKENLNKSIATNVRVKAKINSDLEEEYYMVITPMENVDWLFVSMVPSSVFNEQTRGLMNIFGILLFIVGCALGFIIIVALRQARQQTELKNKAETDKLNEKLTEKQIELEEALDLAQSANRAKTTFLNNMSHDIRTPMNAIIGFTGLASTHIDNKEQVKDYLYKISQSSEHLLSLINDVLDMSRIESGRVSIEEKDEDLSMILHTLRNIVQADIKNKQLDFYIDCDVSDQFIVCDKLRLNQVLLNILSNSIKYTQTGGLVSLCVKQKNTKENGYVQYEFRIKDSGVGMDDEFLKTIFDPFTRAKSSTVSGVQGTGLGMAITKNIIDMMGGTINIVSEVGKGTEMTVLLDFKLSSKQNTPMKINGLEGLRGLVVDDDISACKNVAKMLREIGMRSEWCASGKEAVIRTEESKEVGDLFKVYIIDWLMPDMNGIETARRIRKIVGDEAPIIVLTAYDWSDIEDEAKLAGVTSFVSKPIFPTDLRDVLSKCCGTTNDNLDELDDDIDFSGKKILLVEDNEMNREIAVEILKEFNFIVDTAEDGTIALEKMKEAKPGQYDLILMDVQMPIMNGYEATKQIRALSDPEIANIPIFAMTANAFEEDKQEALKAGMNEHLAKPIEIDKLKEFLKKYLK